MMQKWSKKLKFTSSEDFQMETSTNKNLKGGRGRGGRESKNDED